MLKTVETAQGIRRTLVGIDPRVLEKLGADVLGEDKLIRYIGVSPPESDRELTRQLLTINKMGLVGRVKSAIDTVAENVSFLGVEVIRGRAVGTAYERPVAEDAPRDEASRSLLLRSIHAQVPLLGKVNIESSKPPGLKVNVGEVFVPRPDIQYAVSIPTGAINLEMIFIRPQEPRELWERYMNVQPSPIQD